MFLLNSHLASYELTIRLTVRLGTVTLTFFMAPAPVSLAQTDEHQYWTDHILCKETQARLKHFHRLG